MISVDYEKSLEYAKQMILERYKTCGRCVHDSEGILGPHCYNCKRNSYDTRIDNFEEAIEWLN